MAMKRYLIGVGGALFLAAVSLAGDGPGVSDTPSSTDGLVAFETVARVLQHPRCLNCHPDDDRPLQTDRSTPHLMGVTGGPEGRGARGLTCTACHGKTNGAAIGLPPGVSSEWRLAPTRIAFEGRSAHEIASQLTNPDSTHMTRDELLEHVSHDPLVLWGWDPGPGRARVDVSHEDFVSAFTTWLEAGAPVPPARDDDPDGDQGSDF